MPEIQTSIRYQASIYTVCLDKVVARFGDNLGRLTAIDKLDLLGILAFWQSADTQRLEAEMKPISLGDYLGRNTELQTATSESLDDVLILLADCSEGDAMTLLVAISNQIRDGVYQK